MPTRTSSAEWQGDLKSGHGTMALGSGAWQGPFSFRSRFENGTGTNPEELLAAAHAGCFSMAFSNLLAEAGHPPKSVKTTAAVHLDPTADGPTITKVDLHTDADVPGMTEADFRKHADTAKKGCRVSKPFKGAQITLDAKLTP